MTHRHRLTAAALTIAATAAVASPALAATPPASLTIKETFTLLACPSNPQTTVAIEGCAEHKVVALDSQISTLNKTIFLKLSSAAAQAHFVSANSAWLKFRAADCTSVSDLNAGGTLAPVDYANCLVELNGDRVRELKTFLHDLTDA